MWGIGIVPGSATLILSVLPLVDSSKLVATTDRHRLAACMLFAVVLHLVLMALPGDRIGGRVLSFPPATDLRLRIIPAAQNAPRIVDDTNPVPLRHEGRASPKIATERPKPNRENARAESSNVTKADPRQDPAEEKPLQDEPTPSVQRGISLESAASTARELARESARDTVLDAGRRRRMGTEVAPSESISGNTGVDPVEPLRKHAEKNARADCKHAYSGYGLLAVPFLLKDAVTDSGCKW